MKFKCLSQFTQTRSYLRSDATDGTGKYEAEVDYINIDNSFFPEHSNLAKNAI